MCKLVVIIILNFTSAIVIKLNEGHIRYSTNLNYKNYFLENIIKMSRYPQHYLL